MAKTSIKKPTSLADLKPAPYNPRRIEPAALDGLKASVERFGDISGIVWNARSGHVVAGHQRLKALQERGAVFDADACAVLLGDRRFNVRVVDWDVQMEKAANVAANSPHIAGEFSDGLQDVLDDLAGWDGFEDIRLDNLIESTGVPLYVPQGANGLAEPLPDIGITGEDTRNGRFILVYQNDEEKEVWCGLLGVDGEKVVYLTGDIKRAE